MDLTLTAHEAQVLRRELGRHLQRLQDEVDSHRRDIETLDRVCRKLERAERDQALSALGADLPLAPPLAL